MKPFPDRLREARKRKGWSQETLAKELHQGRAAISSWEQDVGSDTAASPPPDCAVLAAQKLGEDPKEFLLLALLSQATGAKSESNTALEHTVKDLFSVLHSPKQTSIVGPSSHLSLCDFPGAFHEPFTIIVGDKREIPPKTVGDLAAFWPVPWTTAGFTNCGCQEKHSRYPTRSS